MRILMLTQFYQPIIGGEERLVQDLCVELVQRGHEVSVATLWHAGSKEYETNRGVQIFRIRSTTQRASWLYKESQRRHVPPLPDPEATWALRRILARVRPEVVHAHNWLMYSFLPLNWRRRIPLVVTLHDYGLICATRRLVYHDTMCSGPGPLKCLTCSMQHYGRTKGVVTTLAQRMMNAVGLRMVDMFLPISNAVAVGNGLPASSLPFQVIPDFVPDHIDAIQSNTDSYIGQLPNEDYILFVGDLSREKGIHILLRAYAQLRDAPPLVLIGRKCPDTPANFPPNVMFLASWPHAAVMEAWRRCSIAIAPSVWSEPFGLVVIEAMASGRPVIASRTGGIPDIIIDNHTGLLVPPGDPTALRSALERLLADRDLRERMGTAGERRAKDFQASAVVPRIEQVYRYLVQPSLAYGSYRLTDTTQNIEDGQGR